MQNVVRPEDVDFSHVSDKYVLDNGPNPPLQLASDGHGYQFRRTDILEAIILYALNEYAPTRWEAEQMKLLHRAFREEGAHVLASKPFSGIMGDITARFRKDFGYVQHQGIASCGELFRMIFYNPTTDTSKHLSGPQLKLKDCRERFRRVYLTAVMRKNQRGDRAILTGENRDQYQPPYANEWPHGNQEGTFQPPATHRPNQPEDERMNRLLALSPVLREYGKVLFTKDPREPGFYLQQQAAILLFGAQVIGADVATVMACHQRLEERLQETGGKVEGNNLNDSITKIFIALALACEEKRRT